MAQIERSNNQKPMQNLHLTLFLFLLLIFNFIVSYIKSLIITLSYRVFIAFSPFKLGINFVFLVLQIHLQFVNKSHVSLRLVIIIICNDNQNDTNKIHIE